MKPFGYITRVLPMTDRQTTDRRHLMTIAEFCIATVG